MRIKTLTAKETHPDNIAIIEGTDCAKALRTMFAKAHNCDGRYNASVWIDAGVAFTEEEQRLFARQCYMEGVSLLRKNISGKRALDKVFKKASDESLTPLKSHIEKRAAILEKAFPDRDVLLTLRGDPLLSRAGSVQENIHVDEGSDREERFIETLYGHATCLLDNKNVNFGGSFNKVAVRGDDPVLWQVPAGSFSLLTSYKNARKPVMHTPPPRTFDQEEDFRVVAIYDLVEKKHPLFGRFLPGRC